MAGPIDLQKLRNWKPPEGFQTITTLDAHTGGEPLRIVIDGLPELPGNTILQKRQYLKDHLDHYRTILMWEPRGHADMYGCIITPPEKHSSDFGVIFMHNEGYSTMCGHGIIAVTKVALETGLIEKQEPQTKISIDSPAGLITSYADMIDGRIDRIYFHNVASYVQAVDQKIEIDGLGIVTYDLAFGGAFYAYVDADQIGLKLDAGSFSEIIRTGMQIKRVVMNAIPLAHPFEEDLNFLYGTIFTSKHANPGSSYRNVCVFAEGEVDRSPTGTGVSGRVAIDVAKGKLQIGEPIIIESIVGSKFECKAISNTTFGPYQAIVPEVQGSAHISGKHTFVVDPHDPLKNGFILR
ncbi:MAG: proline racemase family protein [Cyclobacteriaceae bacterium]|nr:proline racemase family protein [Cyclobacteriaceae bacterium]